MAKVVVLTAEAKAEQELLIKANAILVKQKKAKQEADSKACRAGKCEKRRKSQKAGSITVILILAVVAFLMATSDKDNFDLSNSNLSHFQNDLATMGE